MDEPEYYICEGCRQIVSAATPGVVHAFERVDVSAFGEREMADGLPVLFHDNCYPRGSPAYRRA